jgi:hypothetical protein
MKVHLAFVCSVAAFAFVLSITIVALRTIDEYDRTVDVKCRVDEILKTRAIDTSGPGGGPSGYQGFGMLTCEADGKEKNVTAWFDCKDALEAKECQNTRELTCKGYPNERWLVLCTSMESPTSLVYRSLAMIAALGFASICAVVCVGAVVFAKAIDKRAANEYVPL